MFLGRILHSPLAGEKIVLYLRKHWFKFFKLIMLYSLFLLAPAILAVLILEFYPWFWDRLFGGALLAALVKLGISFYYLAVWVFFWSAWVDLYLDIWLVTNERILSFEQRGLFNRVTLELRLSRVQDVSAQVKGLAGTVLNFGEVRVQTAGAETNFNFAFAPRPHIIAEKILRLADESRLHNHNLNP